MKISELKSKRIGVLYGGWSAEREISIKSGTAVINALREGGYKVIPIDVDRNFAKKIQNYNIDIAFVILHGPFGEDGTIQSILELYGIPYTGSGVLSSALAMNKIYSKMIFEWYKIPTPQWQVVTKSKIKNQKSKIPFPVVIKPVSQGSAIGVTIAKNKNEFEKGLRFAFKYGDQALIEKYIPGKELTVGIIGETALPVIEIVPVGSKFYDFTAKYAPGGSKHIIPARIDKKLTTKVQEIAKSAFDALECRAVGRMDLMLSPDNKPYMLEVNTLPGLTETSLLPDASKKAGLNFLNMVLEIIRSSIENNQ